MLQQVTAIMNRARTIRALTLTELTQAAPALVAVKPGKRWSALETLIHVGNWEQEGNTMLSCFLKGETPPQEAEKPIDEWNAEHLASYAHLDLAGAIAYVGETRAELERLAAQITEAQLQTNPNFRGLLLMTPDHEIGHLHQMREALAAARGDTVSAALHAFRYSRQRVLTRLNLEYRPTDSLTWTPGDGTWSIKETLLHLAVWDRGAASVFAAVAEGRPIPAVPFPAGGLDEWNRAQVDAYGYMTLADVLAELGAAREAMEVQLLRLTPAQLAASADAQGWLGYREHDDHHMHKILERLGQWRQATR